MKFDENGLPIETCTNCGSERVYFDQLFGFFKCETCDRVWASDEDDPDYTELMDDQPA
jgi:DNA-directed RNA polymerase subunit M/transcription elongation factor TFIIS